MYGDVVVVMECSNPILENLAYVVQVILVPHELQVGPTVEGIEGVDEWKETTWGW
jgi:hypothetical protein